jgi:hypothetical protein
MGPVLAVCLGQVPGFCSRTPLCKARAKTRRSGTDLGENGKNATFYAKKGDARTVAGMTNAALFQ